MNTSCTVRKLICELNQHRLVKMAFMPATLEVVYKCINCEQLVVRKMV